MKKFLQFLLGLFVVIVLSLIHVAQNYFLPYPWRMTNSIFAILIIFLLWRESGWVIWMAFFTHFIIELYTIAPFGILLVSSTLSLLFSYWLYKYIFTNRSWYSALALTAIALILYRAMYSVILGVIAFFSSVITVNWNLLFQLYSWELLFTTILVGLLYFLIPKNKKKGLSFRSL